MNVDMLSLIAGGILFLVSAYIGMAVKNHYKKRRDFFKNFLEFTDVLVSEISFLKTPLPEIIARVSDGKKGEFISLLNAYLLRMREGKPTDANGLGKNFAPMFLSAEEKDAVTGFFGSLGKTDAGTQLLSLKNNRVKTEASLALAEGKYKTTGMLAYKLGVLLGIAIMIFVV